MSRYRVTYSTRAKQDLQESYQWGVQNWGRENATVWLKQINKLIRQRLSLMPLACPLAPEDPGYGFELRHMPIRRYRILFRVSGKTVFVLRIRGPFSGGTLELD